MARQRRSPSRTLNVEPVIPNSETSCKKLGQGILGGTLWANNSDEPKNNALANIPNTNRLTEGSKPR